MRMMGIPRTLKRLRKITMTKRKKEVVKKKMINQNLRKKMISMIWSHSQMSQLNRWTTTMRRLIELLMNLWSCSLMKLEKIKICNLLKNLMKKILKINSHSILLKKKKKLLNLQSQKYNLRLRKRKLKSKRKHKRM